MSAPSRVGSNAAFLAVKVFVASLFGLAQMKIFTRYLSMDGMGLLVALRALANILTALSLMGLTNVAMRFLPQLETRHERARILRFSAALLAGILIGFAVFGTLAWKQREFLAGGFGVAERLLPLALLLALGMGLTEFFYGIYQGLRRMGPVALAELLGAGFLTAHLWLRRQSLDSSQALELLALYFFIRCAILILILPRFLPAGAASSMPLRIERKDLLNYWSLSVVLRWLAMAYLEVDRYVIGMIATLDLVALFHVPAKLVGLSRSFLAAPAVPRAGPARRGGHAGKRRLGLRSHFDEKKTQNNL